MSALYSEWLLAACGSLTACACLQVKFKAKPVPASVTQARLPALQAEQEMRSAAAQQDAQRKLLALNAEFAATQGRVAAAMAAACAPFVGTVEDNIACAEAADVAVLRYCL